MRDWLRSYVLGADFSDEQETALGVNPAHVLHRAFHDGKLNHGDSTLLRKLVKADLLPAVSHLLEGFVPYRKYIAALRSLEEKYDSDSQSDVARHAFHELRFGTNYADESIQGEVNELVDMIKTEVAEGRKRCLPRLIDLDIGMRGVMSAFGQLRVRAGNPEWGEFSTRFTEALNRMYDGGWFNLNGGTVQRKLLLHIAEDHNQIIVNYRLGDYGRGDVDRALGSYIMLFVTAYGQSWPESWGFEEWLAVREECLETLQGTLIRGFKKQVRPELREEMPDGGRKLTEAVNAKAVRLAAKQIARIERELNRVETEGPNR